MSCERCEHRWASGLRRSGVLLTALAVGWVAILGTATAAHAAGGISGNVTSGTGAGREGVRVFALQSSAGSWGIADETLTTADGSYGITLPAGIYRVRFLGTDEYASAFYDGLYDDMWTDVTVNDATDVVVADGQTTPGIDAVLPSYGHITGRVTNLAGEPLAGVDAQIQLAHGIGSGNYGGTTDENGYYDIAGLPAGSFVVLYWDPHHSPSGGAYAPEFYNDKVTFDTAQRVVVSWEKTTADVDVVLSTCGRVEGRVTSSAGKPLQGIDVWADGVTLFDGWGASDVTDTTDADGRYSIGLRASSVVRMSFHDHPLPSGPPSSLLSSY